MLQKGRKIVVVGGGITGLTTAFTLQQLSRLHDVNLDVILMEASHRLGGKIETITKDQFIIERGPESFFDSDKEVRRLASELNIENQLVQHNAGKTYIAVNSQLHKIPTRFLLGGSSEIMGIVGSNLLSVAGKVRATGDLFIKKTSEQMDESITQFFTRRFGKEVVENLVEPLLAGTLAGDIDHLSMDAMFPQFAQLEKSERSLILGFLKNRQGFYNRDIQSKELFYETFEGGLTTLVKALEQSFKTQNVFKGVKVEEIEQLQNGKMRIITSNMPAVDADAVVITTPFNVAKSMLRSIEQIDQTPSMDAATIATVYLAFNKDEIKKYKEAMTVFVSRNSQFAITTCTFINRKWENMNPDGYELLRIYIGRVGDESIVELSDQAITETILDDMQKMFDIQAAPIFSYVSRWQKGMPQYTIGHTERMNKVRDHLEEDMPFVELAGSSYDGIGVPLCVKQGRIAAYKIWNKLSN